MKTVKSRILARRDTKANWDKFADFIPLEGEIIVYLDRYVVDGENKPGIKIGDGKAYCIDLPFVNEYETESILEKLNNHIDNSAIHVSDYDREYWNGKSETSYEISSETLIISDNKGE